MPADALFVAVDVGTTGARACAVDPSGELVAQARRPYATSTPRPGWAEQDPADWRQAARGALADLADMPGIRPAQVSAIGLTGQCPTVAPFDANRVPLGPGLLYRDNRATEEAAEMRRQVGEEAMHAVTGHVATAFHVGPKVLWLRHHEPATFAAVDCFMQPRDVVLHDLTGVTATDETHANSTVLFDLRRRAWSAELLERFELSEDLFPDVAAPWAQVGELSGAVTARSGMPEGCPVVIGAADSQCAAYGSGVAGPGPISEMAGASSCLNSVVGEPLTDVRITHYSHVVPGTYSTELGVNVSGGALTWAVDRLRMGGFGDLEAGAQSTLAALSDGRRPDPRAAAPLFLPYLGDGERDDPTLRAGFIGLSDRHSRDELAYAVLEGVAFAVAETVSILTEAGAPFDELRVGGGGARLATLGQLKADALEVPVRQLEHDSAPVGVALLAAAATGERAAADAALASNLARARCFEPSGPAAVAIRERYAWFLDVRASPAVRLGA
jgi:xylulokinase